MRSAHECRIHLQILTRQVRPLSDDKSDDMAEYVFFLECEIFIATTLRL